MYPYLYVLTIRTYIGCTYNTKDVQHICSITHMDRFGFVVGMKHLSRLKPAQHGKTVVYFRTLQIWLDLHILSIICLVATFLTTDECRVRRETQTIERMKVMPFRKECKRLSKEWECFEPLHCSWHAISGLKICLSIYINMDFWQYVYLHFTNVQMPCLNNYENSHPIWHCYCCYFSLSISTGRLGLSLSPVFLFQGVNIFIFQCLTGRDWAGAVCSTSDCHWSPFPSQAIPSSAPSIHMHHHPHTAY